MACITRCILRWGLISGLALGGATLLIGPDRVGAGFHQLQSKARGAVDQLMDNPTAMRRQLEQLADEYPDRIAEVRGEIAEIDHQVSRLEHDVEISKRVVALTTNDLRELRTLVAQAEAKQTATARTVSFYHAGMRFNIDQAYSEAGRINNVRENYNDRLAQDTHQYQFLSEQKARLTEILDNLEGDFSKYQAQLWQLDRQIDAIERNERLIDLTIRQKATLASYDKFDKIANLHQLEAKLAELRTVQEAQLQALAKSGISDDYFKRAETELGMMSIDDNPFANIFDDVDEEEVEEDDSTQSIAYSHQEAS
jgi:phage shock protein A